MNYNAYHNSQLSIFNSQLNQLSTFNSQLSTYYRSNNVFSSPAYASKYGGSSRSSMSS